MRLIFFLSTIFLISLSACFQKPDKPKLEITHINNICFWDFIGMQTHLSEQLIETLIDGHKVRIAEDKRFRRNNHSNGPSHCDVNVNPLTVYSMAVLSKNDRYIGGRLELYFLDEKLKVAELSMIYAK